MLILVPVSLCARERAGAAEQACTCSHGDGRACPMHHPQPKSASSCSCRSTGDGPSATLQSLFGPAAVLTRASTVVATVATTDVCANPAALPVGAPVNPDPPPPRA
jgi:hypothetical protein